MMAIENKTLMEYDNNFIINAVGKKYKLQFQLLLYMYNLFIDNLFCKMISILFYC